MSQNTCTKENCHALYNKYFVNEYSLLIIQLKGKEEIHYGISCWNYWEFLVTPNTSAGWIGNLVSSGLNNLRQLHNFGVRENRDRKWHTSTWVEEWGNSSIILIILKFTTGSLDLSKGIESIVYASSHHYSYKFVFGCFKCCFSLHFRHYYEAGIMRRLPDKRLTYQFGPNAENWKFFAELQCVEDVKNI